MARLFTDGAEFGDLLFFDITSGNITNVTSPVRSGSRAYSVLTGTYGQKSITAINEFYVRFAWQRNAASSGKLLIWRSSTTEMGSLRVNAAGKFEVYVGTTWVATGTKSWTPNTWYLVEIRVLIANTGGIIQTRIDGASDISFTGDTQPGTATTVDNLLFTSDGGSTNYMDDIACNDTSGTSENSWCGDGRVYLLKPNANGDVSQLVGQDGDSVDNYLNVDEVPHDSDTTYNQSATAGQYDLYNLETLALGNATVKRVWVEARVRELTASGDAIQLGIKTNATEYWSNNITVSGSYARVVGPDYTTNPNTGTTWTQTQIDALQAGIKVV